MSIRLPLKGAGSFTLTGDIGLTSVAGGIAQVFKIEQDTDNVVVKFTASVTAGGASAIFQTSDDGGTTYYDVARTSIVSNGLPQWLSASPIGTGITTVIAPSLIATGSIVSMNQTIGTAAASTLGSRQVSGLPILGLQNRIFVISTGNMTTSSIVTTVSINQQSATA